MADHSHLLYFIKQEIGGNPNNILERIIKNVNLYISNPYSSIDLSLMKEIIWDSVDWPLFITSETNLKYLLDDIIPDRIAVDAMIALDADSPEYRFNNQTKKLVLIPIST